MKQWYALYVLLCSYGNMNLSLDIDITIDIRFHEGNQQLKNMGYI